MSLASRSSRLKISSASLSRFDSTQPSSALTSEVELAPGRSVFDQGAAAEVAPAQGGGEPIALPGDAGRQGALDRTGNFVASRAVVAVLGVGDGEVEVESPACGEAPGNWSTRPRGGAKAGSLRWRRRRRRRAARNRDRAGRGSGWCGGPRSRPCARRGRCRASAPAGPPAAPAPRCRGRPGSPRRGRRSNGGRRRGSDRPRFGSTARR